MANKVLGYIRNIFKRDNYSAGREDGPKYQSQKYHSIHGPGTGYGAAYSQAIYGNQTGSNGTLQEDLLTRYADYEDADEVPELSAALDIVSDDATQTDQLTGKIVHIKSEDPRVAELLDTCFHKNLRIDEEIWEICRTACKYGNDFEEHIINETEGLIAINFLAPPQVRRIDDEDASLIGFVHDATGQFSMNSSEFEQRIMDRSFNERRFLESGRLNNVFEDWEVTHFRLRSKHRGSQYGWSFLESARWVTKRLLMLEDAAILYKLSRAPQRFVFNVDVGDLPPNEALSYVDKVRQRLKKEKIVNPQTGKLDLTSNAWCISLDTQISCLDGRDRTLREMIDDKEKGIQHYVYSYDLEKERFVAGKVVDAKVTRRDAQVVRVTFDNGKSEIVTPDHKFLLRNGDYVRADKLSAGESLMPFYRYIKGGYEYIHHPHSGGKFLEQTHRMVCKTFYDIDSKVHVHHKDENRFNNMPENLEAKTRQEHDKDHAEVRSLQMKTWNQTEEHRQNTIKYNRLYNKGQNIIHYNNSEKHAKDNVIRSESLKKLFRERRGEMCEAMRLKFNDEVLIYIKKCVQENPGATITELSENLDRDIEFRNLLERENSRTIKTVHRHLLLKIVRRFGFDNYNHFQTSCLYNHKVASVEFLNDRQDTGCIEVEKYHNFSLGSGVVIKNSNEEDFFIPTRKDKPSMTVDSVGGFDSSFYMDDIQYFKDKLYAAIKIPKDYLNYSEDSVGKANLSTEDIRAARTIIRIQRMLRTGLINMGRVHLAAMGYDPDLVEFDIFLTPPSSIFEMAMMEVRQAQLDIAENYRAFVDDYWIMTNILKFNEDEIKEINERLKLQKAENDPFSENRFPTIESKKRDMNPEIKKMLDDMGEEAFKKDKVLSRRLDELKGLSGDIKTILRKRR